MKEEYIKQVYYYKNYYLDFFQSLNSDVKKNFNRTIKLIATIESVPVKFLKHIENTDGLYEVRVEDETDMYRVFCFFDKGKLIILILSLIHISEPTRQAEISYAVFCS